jgi:parallel beta-helix repeat protein
LFVERLEERWVPSVFVVNELSDTHAVNLVSGTDAGGQVSLRSAIEAADHLGGNQTIQFDPTVFATPRTITLKLNLLNLNDAGGTIAIQGPADGVTISGNHVFEVFRVAAGTTADLSGLTICQGSVSGWNTDYGGGIYNNGTLTISGSTIANNVALTPAPIELFDGFGGGIYNNASLTLVDSIISGNLSGGAGAGIDNSTSGTATLTDCTVTGNRFASDGYGIIGSGGGLCNDGSASLTDCTISGNSAVTGGGICNDGSLTVAGSRISGNATIPNLYYQGSSFGAGGGVFNRGTATLRDSIISGDTARGAGVNGVGGGIGGAYSATTTLVDCTLSNNCAGSGGGIGCIAPYCYGVYDPVALTDCTISGNQATNSGGGIFLNASDEATLVNSTISGNTAPHGGGVYLNQAAKMTATNVTIAGNSAVDGGGVYVEHTVNYVPGLSLENTIIAGNTSRAHDGDVAGPVAPNSVNDLIGDGSGIIAGIGNNASGNQIGTAAAPIDPLLAPLGDYGGPTQTMALLPASPAIDTGSNSAIPAGVTTDQRGQPRIINGTVDSGAVEYNPDETPVITSANSTTFVVGQTSSFTVRTMVPGAALCETGTLPAGLCWTTNADGTATISGTPLPGAGLATPYAVTLQATTCAGDSACQVFNLTINQAPAITSAAAATFIVGRAGSFTLTTTGFPAAALRASGALPAGLTWTDNGNGTATISGTPAPGTARAVPDRLTIQAGNGVGTVARQTLQVAIVQAPVITSAGAATFVVGRASAFAITVMPGVPAATTFSELGPLPPGVSFNPHGVLHGVSAAGTSGIYAFTISARNGLTATQRFTLTVNQPPAITSAGSATFSAGQAGTFTVSAIGFPAASLTEFGVLPAGLTWTDNGNGTASLGGTPLASITRATVYRLTIRAGNGAGSIATQLFTLTLEPT